MLAQRFTLFLRKSFCYVTQAFINLLSLYLISLTPLTGITRSTNTSNAESQYLKF